MEIKLITTDELEAFRSKLLEDINKLLNEKSGTSLKDWLKSYEVREILGISPGTLQNLRNNGTLPYSKVGGIIFYASADIQKVLEDNKRTFERF